MNTFGELERSVMEQLWAAPEPQSVREVHQALTAERDLAYTTVMTVLDRLAKKTMVARTQAGRAYLYSPAQRREELVAEVMHTALEGDSADRTAALVEFVGRVSADEAETLRAALAALEDAHAAPPPASHRD